MPGDGRPGVRMLAVDVGEGKPRRVIDAIAAGRFGNRPGARMALAERRNDLEATGMKARRAHDADYVPLVLSLVSAAELVGHRAAEDPFGKN